jgi:hypothetical protein
VLLEQSFEFILGAIIWNVLHQDGGVASLTSFESIEIDALRSEIGLCLLDDVSFSMSLLHCGITACRIQHFGLGQAQAGGDTGDHSVGVHVQSVPVEGCRGSFAFLFDLLLCLQR